MSIYVFSTEVLIEDTHFVFINNTLKTASQLRLSSDAEQLIIPTTISPIGSPSKQKTIDVKVLQYLEIHILSYYC